MSQLILMGASSGSSAGAGHKFWRMLCYLSGGQTYIAVAGLEFRATPGGADQCYGGTPFTNGTFNPAWPLANLFDHNNATIWVGSQEFNYIAGYEFAAPVSVTQVAIIARPTGVGFDSNGYNVNKFRIAYADSSSGPWTDVGDFTTSSTWTSNETRTFAV